MIDSLNEKSQNHSPPPIHQIFFPSTPITEKSQCYGRYKEITRITQSLKEPGKHVLLFGGRGYGKTSIANMVTHNLHADHNMLTVKVNCHRSLNTFSEIWHDIFKTILASIQNHYPKFKKKTEYYSSQITNILNKENLGIVEVMDFFKKIDFPILIILDEADLIPKKREQLGLFADILKAFSDQLPQVKLLIIGIGNSSRDLIGEHASLERCLVEVKIDRMNEKDLMDIIDGGLLKINMKADEEVKKNLILFSHGLPFFVHLLTLYAVEDALELNYRILVEKNFQTAMIRSLENMNENLNKIYQKVLGKSPEKHRSILNGSMHLEENSLAEQYYLSRQETNYSISYEKIGFTARELSQYLLKKKYVSLNEKQVTQTLSQFANPSKPSNSSKGIFTKNFSEIERRYCFTNPLFRSFLRYRLYQEAEVPKSVFYIS